MRAILYITRCGRKVSIFTAMGVCNDKGAMAAWMVACDSVRRSEVKLAGDDVLTMSLGEIGLEPVDEYPAPIYVAKEAGIRYVLNRGYRSC